MIMSLTLNLLLICALPRNKAQSFSTQQIIIAVVVTALGVALVLSGIWYCCNRRRRMKEDEKSREARRASGRYSQI